MGRERRGWTPEEDSLLREAVRKATTEGRPVLWRELAKSVPSRTNKDCRRRWCNVLTGGTTKGGWTESEDERLSNAVREYGPKWTRVAAAVSTRNSDQCSSHWSLSLNPAIDYSDWTRIEDEKLLQAIKEHGTNWTMIAATSLPNRTTLALKNRCSTLRTKASQMRGIPKTQLRLDTEDSSVYANSRSDQFNASTSISAPHDARETHDQSDDDDGDDDDEEGDDADDKGLGEDNREDADAEMHDRGTPQSFERQEHPTANAATTVRRTLSSHSTIQPVVYPSSPHNCIEENLDPTSATTGQWQKELQNGPTYSSTFPTGSAPHGYQDNGNHILALADMEFDLGTFPNFGASIYQHQQPHDPGVPQSNTEASYPDPDTTSGVVMGGVSQIAYGGQPFSKVTHQDKPVQANWPSTRRESAPQQDHDLLRYQGLVDQAPVTPDASPGFSKIESQSAQPSTRNTFSLSSEIPQGPLLRVSIDAECTTDELGNLVRTLVGARKVVIKVH